MKKRRTPGKRAKARPAAADAYAAFMSRAYAMELEAAERYTQFADELEAQDNDEVAMLFRKLAEIEAHHAKRILAEMGWASMPALAPAFAWEGKDGPETAPRSALRRGMTARQALDIALRCELEAQKYFEGIASGAARVRAAAEEMADDEREHAALIREWLARVRPPASGRR